MWAALHLPDMDWGGGGGREKQTARQKTRKKKIWAAVGKDEGRMEQWPRKRERGWPDVLFFRASPHLCPLSRVQLLPRKYRFSHIFAVVYFNGFFWFCGTCHYRCFTLHCICGPQGNQLTLERDREREEERERGWEREERVRDRKVCMTEREVWERCEEDGESVSFREEWKVFLTQACSFQV